MANIVLGSKTVISEDNGTTTANFDSVGHTRYVIVKSSADISGADQRSLGYSTSWTDHMYTGNFTTKKVGDVEAYFSGGHGYEAGAVRLQVLWELRDGDGNDVSNTYWRTTSGQVPVITIHQYTHGRVQNCFKQGHSSNHSHGSNSNHIVFPNVAVGTYNLFLRISNNNASGTTAIMNYFIGEQDFLYVYHY